MGVKFYRVPLRRQTIPIKGVTSLPRVPIVVSYAGVDGDIVRSLITAGEAQGLVIAGFGGGTVAGSMFEAIKEARMKRVPVVMKPPGPMPGPVSSSPTTAVKHGESAHSVDRCDPEHPLSNSEAAALGGGIACARPLPVGQW